MTYFTQHTDCQLNWYFYCSPTHCIITCQVTWVALTSSIVDAAFRDSKSIAFLTTQTKSVRSWCLCLQYAAKFTKIDGVISLQINPHKFFYQLRTSRTLSCSLTVIVSTSTSLIRDIYCGPEVLFETCVVMEFVDDDDDGIRCIPVSHFCTCISSVKTSPINSKLQRDHHHHQHHLY